jgi:formylglycine-generating enzyme required for sulfatase activity
MMRVAGRRHLLLIGLLLSSLLFFLFAGVEVTALARSLLVKLRANSAAIWLALGQEETVWPLLRHSEDPTLRTRVIHGIRSVVLNPEEMVDRALNEEDVSVRLAMILVAGEFDLRIPDPSQPLIQKLLRMYRDDPDPGVHAAVEWALRKYQQDEQLARLDRQLASHDAQGDRQWFVNLTGHTMVVIPGPAHFLMGSPDSDSLRSEDETWHTRRIPRIFCIANKETTHEQFRAFLAETPELRRPSPEFPAAASDVPRTSVSWYEAAAYCNWLSRRERIPESEWCYLPNPQQRYAEGMRLAPDWANLRGYRLATEPEWEYASRANAGTEWYFGSGEAYLGEYAVFRDALVDGPLPSGRRKPNDFGLFDTLGNAQEWCQDIYHVVPTGGETIGTTQRLSERPVQDRDERVLRGGSYGDGPADLRCAARRRANPSQHNTTVGFRVARTFFPPLRSAAEE